MLSVAFIMLLQLVFAGGLLTNFNQSAQYQRMLSRNASLDVDAVFYNPAGLVKLENGWHFSLSSQSIWPPLLHHHRGLWVFRYAFCNIPARLPFRFYSFSQAICATDACR